MRKGQKRKHQSKMAEGQEIGLLNGEVHRMDERPEHGMKVLQGLNKLKTDHVLCDVTLIAEGKDPSLSPPPPIPLPLPSHHSLTFRHITIPPLPLPPSLSFSVHPCVSAYNVCISQKCHCNLCERVKITEHRKITY